MTPYIPFSNLPSPNSRNHLQGDGPTYLSSIYANSRATPHKNATDLNNPFMFHPTAAAQHQNGIAGFPASAFPGMNHMAAAAAHRQQAAAQIPHSSAMTAHMPNFNLGNLFSDMPGPGGSSAAASAGGGDSGLSISPIKLPGAHGNPLAGLPGSQAGMEHNLQHHQNYYQNHRQMQPAMLHNLFGHQHPGFHDRAGMAAAAGMNSSMAAPFGGHGHAASFGLPSYLDHHHS